MTETCETCGKEYGIGEWPYCPHGMPMKYHPFVAKFEISLGKFCSNLGDRNKAMRENPAGKLDYAPVKQGEPGCMV